MQIDAADELGTFIFRTTGYNSIRTLVARLQYYQAVSGGLLACLPLTLRLRGKSTTQSHRTPIYYVDLTIREGMTLEGAIRQAQETHSNRSAFGFDQQALDAAARAGLANGAFEESIEEAHLVTEEFYSGDSSPERSGESQRVPKKKLGEKLKDMASPVLKGRQDQIGGN